MVLIPFSFYFLGKKRCVEVIECRRILPQARGLMFRKDSHALLFIFRHKTRQSIHSFFCKPFVALWFDGEHIIDARVVNPWQFSISPASSFNRLLEIPVGNSVYTEIVDDMRKI